MKTKEQMLAELDHLNWIDHKLNHGEHDHALDPDCPWCDNRRTLMWALGLSDPETNELFTTAYHFRSELKKLPNSNFSGYDPEF
jgi:hypothetical protein